MLGVLAATALFAWSRGVLTLRRRPRNLDNRVWQHQASSRVPDDRRSPVTTRPTSGEDPGGAGTTSVHRPAATSAGATTARQRHHRAGRAPGTESEQEREPPGAHHPAVGPQGPPGQGVEEQDTRPAGLAPAARRLHARLHHHPEEAELRPAQGRPRAPCPAASRSRRTSRVWATTYQEHSIVLVRGGRVKDLPVSATRSSAAPWTPRASRTASRLAAATERRRRRADAAQGSRRQAPPSTSTRSTGRRSSRSS